MGRTGRRQRELWQEKVEECVHCPLSRYTLLSLCLVMAVCCIYHKPREFDESSSESESSDAESDASGDGRARPRYVPNRRHHHQHSNGATPSGAGDGLRTGDDSSGSKVVHQVDNSPEPNAYEIQPSHSKKGKGRTDGTYAPSRRSSSWIVSEVVNIYSI